MSEKNPEEKKTSQKKEPIDSIEETVEELRKKIAELDEEEKNAAEQNETKEHTILSDEQKQKVAEIRDSAVKTVNSSIDQIKQKAADIKENTNLDKTVAYIKDHAVKAVDDAKQKITDLKNDPHVQEAAGKTRDFYQDAADKTKDFYQSASEKTKNFYHSAADRTQSFYEEHVSEKTRQNISDGLNKASEGINKAAVYVKDNTRKAVQNVDAFVNRPDVQETIGNIKKGTSDLIKKGADYVSSLHDKKPGEKTEE